MLGILKSAVRPLRLYVLRRSQFDSLRLRAYFKRHHNVDVGLYSYGCFDPWRMPGPMQVGRYCSIAATVRTALVNHPLDALTTHPALYEKSWAVVDQDMEHATPLVIQDDVWIGHNVMILPGCKLIGRGAVIGAGSVVTRDVPSYSIVAGNPARKLRDRFAPELIEALEQSEWWRLELRELAALAKERPDLVSHPTVERLREWMEAGRPPAGLAVAS